MLAVRVMRVDISQRGRVQTETAHLQTDRLNLDDVGIQIFLFVALYDFRNVALQIRVVVELKAKLNAEHWLWLLTLNQENRVAKSELNF